MSMGCTLVARNQSTGGIAAGGDEIVSPLIHQGHHLIGGGHGFDADLTAGLLFKIRHPVVAWVGFAPPDVARPSQD